MDQCIIEPASITGVGFAIITVFAIIGGYSFGAWLAKRF